MNMSSAYHACRAHEYDPACCSSEASYAHATFKINCRSQDLSVTRTTVRQSYLSRSQIRVTLLADTHL